MSLTMALYRRKLKRSQPKKAWVSVEVFGKTNVKDMKVMVSKTDPCSRTYRTSDPQPLYWVMLTRRLSCHS